MTRSLAHVAFSAILALRSGCAVAVMMCALFAISTAAQAQATQPAGRFEDQPVRAARDAGGLATNRATTPSNSVPPIQFDWKRVAVALGIVLALIVLLRLTGRRFFAQHSASGAGKTIRVLGRATTGPRQQVVLLQIGKRIVVAADNSGQLATLCQISDPDEVAALLGQIEESSLRPPKTAFTNWFRKASDDFEDEPSERLAPAGGPVEDPSLETARGEIASLMDRARALTRQMRRK